MEVDRATEQHKEALDRLSKLEDQVVYMEHEAIANLVYDVNFSWQHLTSMLDRVVPDWQETTGLLHVNPHLSPIFLDARPRVVRPIAGQEDHVSNSGAGTSFDPNLPG